MNTPNENSDTQLLRAEVRRVTFHNPTNGYTVMQVAVQGSGEPLTVVGTITDARVGAHLALRGSYRDHPRYGRQFHANSLTETAPETPSELLRYLASGTIKGIGEKTAERIIDALGSDAVQIIKSCPERVAELPGVGAHKAELLRAAFSTQSEAQEVQRFLIGHELSPGIAHRIYQRYGGRTIELLTEDPYRLARDMAGVGFLTADRIAMALGMSRDSPQRIRAGLCYALEKAADEGHCFLPHDQITFRARQLLALGDDYVFDDLLDALVREAMISRNLERYYLPHLIRAEEFVADFVAARCAPRTEPLLDAPAVEAALATASSQLGVTFSAEQRLCVHHAMNAPLMIITGGPGCGKTTIIRALAALFRNSGKRLLLAAPTGRAAQRMAQVCEMSASTIHRLLKYDPVNRCFRHNASDPLVADAIVIDEASMIDLPLALSLFQAVRASTTVILVGDKDQLPSVGPGRVFADLVSMHEVTTVALSQLFRRSEQSQITEAAHHINAGRPPEIPSPDGQTKSDAYFVSRSDAGEAATTIEKLVSDLIPKKFSIESSDITVLTPSNRGPLGIQTLNKVLQSKLNPQGDPEAEVTYGDAVYRVGDRVCQLVNNYNLGDVGVFNGDIGVISQINKSAAKMTVDMWDGRLITYDTRELHQIGLAYAMTVHRSQGSEMPCVVLALHDSHYTLLERQLIYTAVTRAKKLLVLVGSRRALLIATKRTNASKRLTALVERIRAIVKNDDRDVKLDE